MNRIALLLMLPACGARTELDVVVHDASTDEATVPPSCDYGTLVADVFGATTFWNGGATVPAGHYRVTYVDGCLKYSSSQGWTVNAYANGPDTMDVVTSGNAVIEPAPGTVGFFVNHGAFATFDACVAANQSDAPLEFDFAGGALGLRLADDPYTDNIAGESGRNPTYRLSSCK